MCWLTSAMTRPRYAAPRPLLSARMVELVLELLFEIFGEALFDVAAHSVRESGRVRRTIVRVLIFGVAGAAIGAVSIVLVPFHLVRDPQLRMLAAGLTPITAGIVFAAVGRRRARKAKRVTGLEAFWPAFAFALAMALVRYFGAA